MSRVCDLLRLRASLSLPGSRVEGLGFEVYRSDRVVNDLDLSQNFFLCHGRNLGRGRRLLLVIEDLGLRVEG